jgi:hypothetical protein
MLLPEKIFSDDSFNIKTPNRGLCRERQTKRQFSLTSLSPHTHVKYAELSPQTLLKYAERDPFTPVINLNWTPLPLFLCGIFGQP